MSLWIKFKYVIQNHVDHLKSIDKTSHDEQEDIPYAQDLVASPRNVIPNISVSAPVPVSYM